MTKKEFEKKFVNKIIHGKCRKVMKDMPDNCIDTICTDPPYGLGFMGKKWDTFAPENIKNGVESNLAGGDKTARGRNDTSPAWVSARYDHSRNAKFQQWCKMWTKEALRIAKPGAMMFVFGGTRTFHRLTCAIEDAGWEIRDCMMWLYGSGFPKSLDISKAIDKAKGAEREVVGSYSVPNIKGDAYGTMNEKQGGSYKNITQNITTPATDLAKQWNGWGTALKPSWEPIIVAMKPLDGTFAENVEKWGVGGLWIDGGRIGTDEVLSAEYGQPSGSGCYNWNKEKKKVEKTGKTNNKGRWPANVILDEEAAAMLDKQSGVSNSTDRVQKNNQGWGDGIKYGKGNAQDSYGFADSGGCSRFFYTAKASKSERDKENKHPTVKPLSVMEYLCKLARTPTGGIVLDPFGGSGTTALACKRTHRSYILIEKNPKYCEIARQRIKKMKTGISVTQQKQGFNGLLG